MGTESDKTTWKSIVADALSSLGGEGHLSEINEAIEGHPKTATNPTWRDTIRRVVRQYSIFMPVPPERSGRYRLVETHSQQPRPEELDASEASISHGVAQGMLVSLGALYGYETFVPKTDQTMREFQGQKLSELVSIRDCTPIFKGPNLAQIREIDVLWFAEDEYGAYPVYGFEVEHTTKVRTGLDRLLKIPQRFAAQMIVVGPSDAEKELFERRVAQTPFRAHRHRFSFRLYEQLERLYNAAVEHVTCRDDFGLVEQYNRQ